MPRYSLPLIAVSVGIILPVYLRAQGGAAAGQSDDRLSDRLEQVRPPYDNWNAGVGYIKKLPLAHGKAVVSLAVTPDGRTLASASADRTIKLWSLPDGIVRKTISGHTGTVSSVAISPDGRYLVSGSVDKSVRLWSLPDGEPVKTLTPFSGTVNAVAISPDGKMFAAVSDDKTAVFWSLPDCAVLRTHQDSDGIDTIAFSPGGDAAAITTLKPNLKGLVGGYPIKVISLADGSIKTLAGKSGLLSDTGHGANILSVAFGQDGRLFSSDMAGTVVVWDTDGKPRQVDSMPGRFALQAWGIALSPDKSAFAVVRGGVVIGITGPPTKCGILRIGMPDHSPQALAFLPDGRGLLTGGKDGRILLWLWSFPKSGTKAEGLPLKLSDPLVDAALSKGK